MSDEESYGAEEFLEKDADRKYLEPFGNEEKAEVKYRTMKWW